ncbi:MAG TPA: MAPEG family protein [Rhizomicrobium sp.]|jgi:uncharacterized MAPEG superfamily protein|nr:MAPEG family protein [Rhizomicrobium sp.]
MQLEEIPVLQLGGMSVEFTMLALAIVLGFVHLFLAAQVITSERGFVWNAGARDNTPPLKGKLAGRLDRAFANFKETFAFFAVAVLMAAALGRHNWMTVGGAELYLAGRIIYLPLYAMGIPFIRTLVWLASTVGIALIVIALFVP